MDVSVGNISATICSLDNSSITLRVLPYVLLMPVSFVANVLVVLVVLRNPCMRRTVNFFIVNVALADLFIPVFFMTREVSDIINQQQWKVAGIGGEIMCKLSIFLPNVAVAVSSFSMVFLAADRFIAVVFPMKVHAFTKRLRRKLIIFSWVFSLSIHTPDLYIYRLVINNKKTYCLSLWSLNSSFSTHLVYTIFLSTTVMVFPFTLLLILYSLIMITLCRKDAGVTSGSSRGSQIRKIENRKVSRTSTTIVVAFFACWTPLNVIMFIDSNSCSMEILRLIAILFGSANSVVNPCICFCLIDSYQRFLREMFCSLMKNRKTTINEQVERQEPGGRHAIEDKEVK